MPVSVDRPLAAAIFVRGHADRGSAAGGSARPSCAISRGILAARPAQRAERSLRLRRRPGIAASSRRTIAAALKTFPGLPHRLEEVGRKGRVLFVNDSKATNADSAAQGAVVFPGDIFWILGGKAKEGGITPLTRFFPKIAKAYLIGEATEEFAAALEGKVPYVAAARSTSPGREGGARRGGFDAAEPVVLLSPACASFDQYRNFEIRGDHFRELVKALLPSGAFGHPRSPRCSVVVVFITLKVMSSLA